MPGFGEVNRQCLWGVCRFWGWQGLDRFCAGVGAGMEEGNSVVAPAASLGPSAGRNPLIREKPRI